MYNLIKNSIHISTWAIKNHVSPGSIVLDCTLGNGYDTVKLLKQIGPNGRLYGMDLQEEAIESSLSNIRKNGLEDYSFQLINDGHENVDSYIKEDLDFVIYNLGYLPNGDKEIVTKPETTTKSIEKSLKLLKMNGVMVILSYLSHRGGKEENAALLELLTSLDQRQYNVLECSFINQKNEPPKTYIIEKSNRSD